ncbi:DUF6631 family protein [Zestomonas thermotolerans]|uniref:DUF6631 family protein n=1 Tax=Zestomonas thermotolerans TaxID=157784 RepID=UPI000361EE4D|nr:DUF6631 family protein [Pseudomonas thermotolerans]
MTDIAPLKVKDLPAFLAAIEPVARELVAGDIFAALAKHADGVIEATAIGARVDRQWLEEQPIDVLVDLAIRVLEVNADFFVRQVLPRITAAAERLAALQAASGSGGTNGSPGSSAQASAIGT